MLTFTKLVLATALVAGTAGIVAAGEAPPDQVRGWNPGYSDRQYDRTYSRRDYYEPRYSVGTYVSPWSGQYYNDNYYYPERRYQDRRYNRGPNIWFGFGG